MILPFLLPWTLAVALASAPGQAPTDVTDFRDEGRHAQPRMETWNIFGLLEGPKGEKVGIAVTFFDGRWTIFSGGAVMMAAVNESEGKAAFDEEIFLPLIGDIRHREDRLDERFGHQRLVRDGDVLRLSVDRGPLVISLEMSPVKTRFAAGAAEGYVIPRMRARGKVSLSGIRGGLVTGWAQMSHVWSETMADDRDAFIVLLDDGTDMDLGILHDPSGAGPLPGSYATLSDPDGRSEKIPVSLLTPDWGAKDGMDAGLGYTVVSWWTSPASRRRYPAGWEVRIPGEDLAMRLEPAVADQELRALGVAFWIGSCRVTAVHRGRTIGGRAYAVLLGHPKHPR